MNQYPKMAPRKKTHDGDCTIYGKGVGSGVVRSAGERGQALGTGGAQLYSLEAGKVQSLREFGES